MKGERTEIVKKPDTPEALNNIRKHADNYDKKNAKGVKTSTSRLQTSEGATKVKYMKHENYETSKGKVLASKTYLTGVEKNGKMINGYK